MSPVSSAGMIISSAKTKRAAGGDAEPQPEARALQPRELRPREVQRGERGDEREQPGRDPARAAEDVEQRVVLEAREDELDHLPERLLDIAGVGAEEADQRGVGQRREDEAGDEDDRERADPMTAGRDDRRRLPELPELADELGLRGGGAGRGTRRRVRFRLPRRSGAGSARLGFGSGFLAAGGLGRGGRCTAVPLDCRRTRSRRAAVRAEARAVLQPLAALVAERHPGRRVAIGTAVPRRSPRVGCRPQLAAGRAPLGQGQVLRA